MAAALRVGWIGLGHIGAPMAERVRAAGFPFTVWARRPAVCDPWRAQGVAVAASPEALAAACDVVVTVVGGPDDVLGLHRQLMPAARPGTIFIDHSTAAPATGEALAALAAQHGMRALEGPVTGGTVGAERGTLTTFVGGSAEALEAARTVLQSFSGRIVHCGAAGSGYRTKLLNQTFMVGALLGVADGARIARAAGLDAAFLQPALAGGSGDSLIFNGYLARMMSGAGAANFSLGLLLKDLRLARAEAASLGVPAPLLDAAIATVADGVARHGADAGMQALGL